MKSIQHLILGLAALLLLAACGPSRYTNSSVNLASVPEYAFIEPYSYIVLYGDDGKGYYNEEGLPPNPFSLGIRSSYGLNGWQPRS